MIQPLANMLSRVKIALAVTAMASTLQVIYHPSKDTLHGPVGGELTTFLLFGLLKVLGFMTLSLLCARALYTRKTLDGDLRKADMFLFAMVMGALLLALYVFAGMKAIQSEAFLSWWGAGTAFLVLSIPHYRRQYYDMAVIVNAEAKELTKIRNDSEKNSRFVKTLAKKFAIYLLPLLGVHIFILKMSAKTTVSIASSLADGFVTCVLAIASGYAIASTLQEMAEGPATRIR